MDGTLTLIFANSKTTQDIITRISVVLQLSLKLNLTKFGGRSSNGHLETSNFVQSRILVRLTTGENLVLISLATFE